MRRAEGRRHTAGDYARVIEAAWYLAVARLAIRLVPFRHLTRVFTRPVRPQMPWTMSRRRAIAEVRWALDAAGARLPGDTPCFARAVAAQALLRRRGVCSTLFYGATTAGAAPLRAHAWLSADGEGVVGQEIAGDYAVLATYSNVDDWIVSTARSC